jgi:hypothetical protein
MHYQIPRAVQQARSGFRDHTVAKFLWEATLSKNLELWNERLRLSRIGTFVHLWDKVLKRTSSHFVLHSSGKIFTDMRQIMSVNNTSDKYEVADNMRNVLKYRDDYINSRNLLSGKNTKVKHHLDEEDGWMSVKISKKAAWWAKRNQKTAEREARKKIRQIEEQAYPLDWSTDEKQLAHIPDGVHKPQPTTGFCFRKAIAMIAGRVSSYLRNTRPTESKKWSSIHSKAFDTLQNYTRLCNLKNEEGLYYKMSCDMKDQCDAANQALDYVIYYKSTKAANIEHAMIDYTNLNNKLISLDNAKPGDQDPIWLTNLIQILNQIDKWTAVSAFRKWCPTRWSTPMLNGYSLLSNQGKEVVYCAYESILLRSAQLIGCNKCWGAPPNKSQKDLTVYGSDGKEYSVRATKQTQVETNNKYSGPVILLKPFSIEDWRFAAFQICKENTTENERKKVNAGCQAAMIRSALDYTYSVVPQPPVEGQPRYTNDVVDCPSRGSSIRVDVRLTLKHLGRQLDVHICTGNFKELNKIAPSFITFDVEQCKYHTSKPWSHAVVWYYIPRTSCVYGQVFIEPDVPRLPKVPMFGWDVVHFDQPNCSRQLIDLQLLDNGHKLSTINLVKRNGLLDQLGLQEEDVFTKYINDKRKWWCLDSAHKKNLLPFWTTYLIVDHLIWLERSPSPFLLWDTSVDLAGDIYQMHQGGKMRSLQAAEAFLKRKEEFRSKVHIQPYSIAESSAFHHALTAELTNNATEFFHRFADLMAGYEFDVFEQKEIDTLFESMHAFLRSCKLAVNYGIYPSLVEVPNFSNYVSKAHKIQHVYTAQTRVLPLSPLAHFTRKVIFEEASTVLNIVSAEGASTTFNEIILKEEGQLIV